MTRTSERFCTLSERAGCALTAHVASHELMSDYSSSDASACVQLASTSHSLVAHLMRLGFAHSLYHYFAACCCIVLALFIIRRPSANMPKALIYRSEATVGEEALVNLLRNSQYKLDVAYCGPNESIHFTADALQDVEVFAVPGGDDLDTAYEEMKHAKDDLREWIKGGGRYLGMCLGAYLCGRTPGFAILPEGADMDSEYELPGSQITDDKDSIIQMDWTYQSGSKVGTTIKDQWIFFQEGACITDFSESPTAIVLGRYSRSGRVAATLNKFGGGWVACVGPHPEADQTWCKCTGLVLPSPPRFATDTRLVDKYNLPTPHGLRSDIGYDVVAALMG